MSNSAQRAYIAKQVRKKNYQVLLQEVPRADPMDPEPMEQVHANERAEGRTLRDTLTTQPENTALIIDPACGLKSLVMVPAQHPDLPELEPTGATEEIKAQELVEDMVHIQSLTRQLIAGLVAGTISSFDDIVGYVPPESLEKVLEQVARAYKKNPVTLNTSREQFSIGGIANGAPIKVASSQKLLVRGVYRGWSSGSFDTTIIGLAHDSSLLRDEEFLKFFGEQMETEVLLSTAANGLTLRALKFSADFESEVQVNICRVWNLRRGKWELHLTELVEEADFLAKRLALKN
ncbi:MAG: hypothetical protein ING66_07345 [Rhodocyclaceae bacterium]|nr:hypothetical protein [Rhodocyclaceae bacterium]MCA3021448.1 hypothetical protein [Rhodocyclaceae bacterium]MCA3028398.1 hypothetical protein [Rhodocyclaceae bacterium]MCA3034584.1 hypothetical protein [Rhodocyclaceae bacterium]MCA3044001.1 hypothetical protein [Rhodocyclaceae bacterium]